MSKPGIDYIGIATPFYCNDGKGNFLFHKRSSNARDEKGRWDFGAGQLEFGEEVEKGVLREIYEEYGVKGKIQEQVPPHSILRVHEGRQTHWIAMPFFVEIDIRKAKIMEPHKVSEIGVFTLDNLPKPFHSGAAYSMKKYKKIFDKYRKMSGREVKNMARKKKNTAGKAIAMGVAGAAVAAGAAAAVALSSKKNRKAAEKMLTDATKKGEKMLMEAKMKAEKASKKLAGKAKKTEKKVAKKAKKTAVKAKKSMK